MQASPRQTFRWSSLRYKELDLDARLCTVDELMEFSPERIVAALETRSDAYSSAASPRHADRQGQGQGQDKASGLEREGGPIAGVSDQDGLGSPREEGPRTDGAAYTAATADGAAAVVGLALAEAASSTSNNNNNNNNDNSNNSHNSNSHGNNRRDPQTGSKLEMIHQLSTSLLAASDVAADADAGARASDAGASASRSAVGGGASSVVTAIEVEPQRTVAATTPPVPKEGTDGCSVGAPPAKSAAAASTVATVPPNSAKPVCKERSCTADASIAGSGPSGGSLFVRLPVPSAPKEEDSLAARSNDKSSLFVRRSPEEYTGLEHQESALTLILRRQACLEEGGQSQGGAIRRYVAGMVCATPAGDGSRTMEVRVHLPPYDQDSVVTMRVPMTTRVAALRDEVVRQQAECGGKLLGGGSSSSNHVRLVTYELRLYDEDEQEPDYDCPPFDQNLQVGCLNVADVALCPVGLNSGTPPSPPLSLLSEE
ncbi:unnamed protein product, partial [Polarella glacialis]